MKKLGIILSCLTIFSVLALVVLPVGAAKRPVTVPTDQIEMGMFIDYGYNSPPWYPAECSEYETDTYRWAPKYYWAVPSITVKVNPTASGFASGELYTVVGEVEKGFEVWDTASGPYSVAVTRDDYVGPSLDYPDGVNTVSWGVVDGPGRAIAVTYYWYNRITKELVDADTIFDVAEPWFITEEGNKFDVWNISAHEAGHFLVLQDIRSPKDCGLTMHAYTWWGDITKRDLGLGDELGIQAIYGE